MIGDEQVAVLNPSGGWSSNEDGIIADFTPPQPVDAFSRGVTVGLWDC